MNLATLDPSSLPDAFALLARAVEVELEDGEIEFGRRSWLAADPRGRALLIGPDYHAQESAKGSRRDLPAAAVRLRGRFVGRPASGIHWTLSRLPSQWEDLGPAVSILYMSDKDNGGGTGRPELFRHDFSRGANAYRAGEYLAIVGDRIRVDAAGIRN